MHLDVCLIIGTCSGRFGLVLPMMQVIFCTSHVHAYFMHTYPFISLFLVVMCFFSLSPLDRLRMAPKHKSTPARNPLGSRSSSSNPPVPPLHVRFHNGKAQQDFLENFQKRGVHPKHHVVLSDFSNTPLPVVIRTRS